MNCRQFRDRFSEFADGLLDGPTESAFRSHLVGCAGCRRFEAAFRTGVGLLRGLPCPQVSREFEARLRSRLETEPLRAEPSLAQWSGVAGAILVVAAVAVAAWDLRPRTLFKEAAAPRPSARMASEPVRRHPADTQRTLHHDSLLTLVNSFQLVPAPPPPGGLFVTHASGGGGVAVWAAR
jgi:anti-sigma factor RsiW